MNNRGFTLVELLAVIVILAIITGIGTFSVIAISNNTKTKMYCKKVKMMEEAAKMYGQDNIASVVNADPDTGYIIDAKTLLSKSYIKKDEKTNDESRMLVNPRGQGDKNLIDYQFKITRGYGNNYGKNRIYAECIEKEYKEICDNN